MMREALWLSMSLVLAPSGRAFSCPLYAPSPFGSHQHTFFSEATLTHYNMLHQMARYMAFLGTYRRTPPVSTPLVYIMGKCALGDGRCFDIVPARVICAAIYDFLYADSPFKSERTPSARANAPVRMVGHLGLTSFSPNRSSKPKCVPQVSVAMRWEVVVAEWRTRAFGHDCTSYPSGQRQEQSLAGQGVVRGRLATECIQLLDWENRACPSGASLST